MLRRYSFLLFILIVAGCNEVKVDGSGVIKTESRPVGKFSAIQLTGAGKLMIERTGTESLSVTADDNLLRIYTSEVRSGTLYLSVTEDKRPSQAPVYTVTLNELRKIDISGAGTIEATKLDGASLSIAVAGAANGNIAGRADDLTIAISGAGSLNAAALQARRGKVSVSGAGQVTVNASDELDARVSGVGAIWYIGDPKLTSDVSGVGTIRKKPL